MNCNEAKAVWTLEPLEALDAATRSELDAHTAGCTACGREVRLLEAIKQEMPAIAAPYRAPRTSLRWLGAAAAVLLAVLYLVFLTSTSSDEIERRLGAHLAVSETFCREAERLDDSRLLAAEWEVSGLRETTDGLEPADVARHFGQEPSRYVAVFKHVGELIQSGRPVSEIRRALAEADALELAGRLRPCFHGTARITLPSGDDEVAKFASARASYFAGQTRQAETLFDLFCDEHPSSPLASGAAYWGADCARRRGDTATLLEFLSRIDGERWVDDRVVADFQRVMAMPGASVRADNGRAVVVVLVDGQPVTVTPSPMLWKRAQK